VWKTFSKRKICGREREHQISEALKRDEAKMIMQNQYFMMFGILMIQAGGGCENEKFTASGRTFFHNDNSIGEIQPEGSHKLNRTIELNVRMSATCCGRIGSGRATGNQWRFKADD
jgi:hypothetical protein